MENITALLQQLAEKLGTTSQYLWGILIAQARISAINSLITMVVFILFGFALWKLHKYFLKPIKDDESQCPESLYEKFDDGLPVLMFVVTLFYIGILSIIIIVGIKNTISGFVNPEYWALDYVLDALNI